MRPIASEAFENLQASLELGAAPLGDLALRGVANRDLNMFPAAPSAPTWDRASPQRTDSVRCDVNSVAKVRRAPRRRLGNRRMATAASARASRTPSARSARPRRRVVEARPARGPPGFASRTIPVSSSTTIVSGLSRKMARSSPPRFWASSTARVRERSKARLRTTVIARPPRASHPRASSVMGARTPGEPSPPPGAKP